MKIRILRSAMIDMAEARHFYDRQGEGLGDYFFDTLFSDIDSLALYGGIHLKIENFHRLLSRKFPYAIYYKVVDEVVIVFRILDCRQNPPRITDALKKSGF